MAKVTRAIVTCDVCLKIISDLSDRVMINFHIPPSSKSYSVDFHVECLPSWVAAYGNKRPKHGRVS